MVVALVVGGTGFVGRYAVAELLDHGYDVTVLSRGTHELADADSPGNPAGTSSVDVIAGDRTDPDTMHAVARAVDPDVVIDCAAFHPADVQRAIECFADVDAYVYVSSGAVYGAQEIPKREVETPLHECTSEQATDDSWETYGPRKAACDRAVATAADRGVNALTVRPTLVYGPLTFRQANWVDADTRDSSSTDSTGAGSDAADTGSGSPSSSTLHSAATRSWTARLSDSWAEAAPEGHTRLDYWIDRVDRYDRVVVPGDGTAIWHRVYVEDVASALRMAAERGEPGVAYNAGDLRVCTLADTIGLIADALDTRVEIVTASKRELATHGLDPNDFPLYHHATTAYPHVLDTCRLASLGWKSTPVATAMERTVAEFVGSTRDGSVHGPSRDAEERLLGDE